MEVPSSRSGMLPLKLSSALKPKKTPKLKLSPLHLLRRRKKLRLPKRPKRKKLKKKTILREKSFLN